MLTFNLFKCSRYFFCFFFSFFSIFSNKSPFNNCTVMPKIIMESTTNSTDMNENYHINSSFISNSINKIIVWKKIEKFLWNFHTKLDGDIIYIAIKCEWKGPTFVNYWFGCFATCDWWLFQFLSILIFFQIGHSSHWKVRQL